VPEIRYARPKEVPELGLTRDKPMYLACKENPHLFAFLNRPWDFEQLMWQGLYIEEER